MNEEVLLEQTKALVLAGLPLRKGRGAASVSSLCSALSECHHAGGLLKQLGLAVCASSSGHSPMPCVFLGACIEINVHCSTLLETYLGKTSVIHASNGLFP